MAHDFRNFSPGILSYISRVLRQSMIVERHGEAMWYGRAKNRNRKEGARAEEVLQSHASH